MIAWLTDPPPGMVVLDIPGGWVTIILALITAVIAPVALLLVTARINRRVKGLKADSTATRYQVENDHKVNMRVEGDDRHDEVTNLLTALVTDVRAARVDIQQQRTDHSHLVNALSRALERIHQLELKLKGTP